MRNLHEVSHLSVSINRPPRDVYEFARDPRNLPKWALGLSSSVELVGGEWIGQAPMGRVKIRFAEANDFGILDHDVTLESGVTIRNPVRVLPNGSGSEVVFSIFRRPEVSSAQFAEDAKQVATDLSALQRALE